VFARLSGAPLTVLNYEGVAGAKKCSCDSEIFAFAYQRLIGGSGAAVLAYVATARFSCRLFLTTKGFMAVPSTQEITQLLIAWNNGDEAALEQLTPLVHSELHRLAKRYMARERQGHILQTTALVNEAWLRLIDWENVEWKNRAHFFGLAARIMRRILVDFARARRREKRGGGEIQVSLSEAANIAQERSADLVALDDALQTLEKMEPRQAHVVELRFFAGLSLEETAEALKVSLSTVRRDWSLVEAWLYRELNKAVKSGE
jgi:RNA polymerase sigma factor (TIGR02999 family)